MNRWLVIFIAVIFIVTILAVLAWLSYYLYSNATTMKPNNAESSESSTAGTSETSDNSNVETSEPNHNFIFPDFRGNEEYPVLLPPEPTYSSTPTNMRLLFYNYASCDGVYVKESQTGSQSIYKKDNGFRTVVWDLGRNAVNCLNEKQEAFGERIIVDANPEQDRSATWKEFGKVFMRLTGHPKPGCDGVYTEDANSNTFKKVNGNTFVNDVSWAGQVACLNQDKVPITRPLRIVDNITDLYETVTWKPEPATSSPDMVLSGFNYASCDGVYRLETDSSFYRKIDGTLNVSLFFAPNTVNCLTGDRRGSYGSRTIVPYNPVNNVSVTWKPATA